MPTGNRTSSTDAARGKPGGVQVEGDYISARKYNERTRAFVDQMEGDGKPAVSGKAPDAADLEAAEKKALARSRGREGDRADASAMKSHVLAADRKPGTTGRKNRPA